MEKLAENTKMNVNGIKYTYLFIKYRDELY